jgi:hypothetical protein
MTLHIAPTFEGKKNTPQLTTARYERLKHKILPQIHKALTEIPFTAQDTPAQKLHKLQTTLQNEIKKQERIPPRKRARWITRKLRKLIRKQHKAHQLRLITPTNANISRHKRIRNRLKKEIIQAKKEKLKQQLENAKHNPKDQAKILKTLLPNKTNARSSPTTLHYDQKTYTDPKDIANALNDHFITIGKKTTANIPEAAKAAQPHNNGNNYPPFKLNEITEDDVLKKLTKLNANKASDIYGIKPAIIKDLKDYLAPILTQIYNDSIRRKEYPDTLKLTKVLETYKAKDRTLPQNYRPISLLPILAKVFDTLLNDQLMQHLTENNLLSPTQYAFRPNSDITLALLSTLNYIHDNTNKRKPTMAIYLDLSKAFDTISHETLLHKLKETFNFSTTTLQFFSSYFKNRLQATYTEHSRSDLQTVTHGIPQGSTLSTTLFLLYINDILSATQEGKLTTYADDTTLAIAADNLQQLLQIAQTELNSLIYYFYSNNLVPNPDKTTYTLFYPKEGPHPVLTIGNRTLEPTNSTKVLGIQIKQDLKYNQIITKIIQRLHTNYHTLKYATKFLPTEIMIKLYYAHIYPHLIYGISIWGTSEPHRTYIRPLHILHKKIIRKITKNARNAHTKNILQKHKILTIYNLYIQRVTLEMHKYVYPKQHLNRPEHQHTYTRRSDIHGHYTRLSAQHNYYQPHSATAYYTQKFIGIWNALPHTLTTEPKYATFKEALKIYLLQKQAQDQP